MDVGVDEVARRLGISDRRVRGLIQAGRLPARKIGGRWVVEEAVVPRQTLATRPMSPQVAWALIELLSGERPEGLPAPELSRLRARQRKMLRGADRAAVLRAWLPTRAEPRRLSVAAGDLPDLLADARVIPSGISDARAGLSAVGEGEAYVQAADLDSIVSEYLLSDVGRPNLWLHVTDRALHRPPPLGLVIADLADRDGPREDAQVERLLGDAS